MLVKLYAEDLASIKTDLSRYSHLSVFNAALNYLQPSSGARGLESMPWVVMFLLKLSLQQQDGPLHIGAPEFLRLANRIYRLGDHVAKGVSSQTMFLMMRSLLLQQIWYQGDTVDSWRSLFIQRALLNRSYEENNRLFQERAGLSLDDYYKLTMCLFSLTGDKKPNSVISLRLGHFYSLMSPRLSDEVLVNFLRLVALPFNRLSEYLQQERFVVKDSNPAELYQETPLKNKPIIIESDRLVIFNAGLCISGLRSIAIELLKAAPGFTDTFGHDMESYIGERLKLTAMDVYTIPDLNQVIPIKSGKIADYVVTDGDELLIFESKSIFPNVLMKCAFDANHLFKLLEDNFIKAIEQGQETAAKLAASNTFGGRKARIIIVTLDDFFIYGGDFVTEHLNGEFEKSLASTYGRLPVPMANVVYMTLRDLITLTEWLKDKPADSLFRLLGELDAKQDQPGGARLSLSHHIHEHVASSVNGAVGIHEVVEESRGEVEGLLLGNSRHWKLQHPLTFMLAYDRFKQRLIRSFA